MTATANNTERPPRVEGLIELNSRVPRSALTGDEIRCEWRLTNNSDVTVTASFYLRTTPARLAALTCSHGSAQPGYFHGSASVRLAAGNTATISARLGPRSPGDYQLRVAVVTRYEVLERTDMIRSNRTRRETTPRRTVNEQPWSATAPRR